MTDKLLLIRELFVTRLSSNSGIGIPSYQQTVGGKDRGRHAKPLEGLASAVQSLFVNESRGSNLMAGSLRPLQLELESVSAVTASTLRQAWRLLPVSFRDIFWAVVSYLQVSTPVNYRRHNSANLNTEIEATVSNADVIRSMLSGWGLQLSSISLLEVGPGPNFGAQLLLSQYGARVTVADRFLAQWDQTYHPLFYSRLRDRVGGDTSLLDAVIVANAYLPEAITLVAAPAETLSGIPDSSIDVVSSNAVLEHVYDLEAACRMFARVTKKGGINSHQVDFRDHSNFDKPLEFLLEGYIASKFIFIKKRGERGNRFRPSELIRFMQSAGFKTVEVDINLTADEAYLRDFIPRLRNSRSKYRNWPEDDLRILGARITARR
jgi:SAM-dependent methyltransferase